ncbi:hypothetical protein [Hymenobacter sp. B81]|uniref:hypothetical protein n=1 Tax=Hymenobacter sp. B81 TaxID=3344878 RepID=UPI0037DC2C60
MQTSTLAPLKRLLSVVGFLLMIFVLSPTESRAQTWLVSTDPYVKLGVMDKFGQLGTYTAKFVVTNQTSGKEYTLVKEVEKGQNGVDVVFPSPATDADYFKTDAGEAAKSQPGRYVWQCMVGGKKVVGGKFDIPNVANDVTVVEKGR